MLVSVLSDKDLIKNYLAGDNPSFEILLNRHKSRVYAFIMSKIKNRDISEDIFQDTFIKVINSLKKGKYNEEGKFLPWIMRISHNLVIDHFRKESKIKSVRPNDQFNIFDIIKDDSLSQDEQMIRKRIHLDLNLLIDDLPIEQMNVLRMRYFEDMSFKEISAKTGVSINTALGRMRYALINLRSLAEDKNIDLSHK
jgi:RNA polymerase sigma-70 factor (ECF subfamily)